MEILGKISILRKVINVDGSIDLIEHHGFSDAILPNYGASVYEIVFEKKKILLVIWLLPNLGLLQWKRPPFLLGNLLLSKLVIQ